MQRGSKDEFARFETLMLEVRAQLAPGALLLAIPGNHDLVRPKAADSAVAGLMQLWGVASKGEGSVQELFWKDTSSSQRHVVETAFANYVEWWKGSALNPANAVPDVESRVSLSHYHSGLLPGDFRATITRNDIRLGVIGLNSTFLQLTGGNLQGTLSVGLPQITHLEPDLPKWVHAHHLAFLMTHQPPDWLTKKAVQDLSQEINPPGRFALHLMGHMHEGSAMGETYGNSPERRLFQGRSWFGMEYFCERDEADRQPRSHGYALGRISWKGSKKLRLRIWPRAVVKSEAGSELATDHSAGVLTAETYIEYAVTPTRQVASRRLTQADTDYFAKDVYPLIVDRLPAADVRPVEYLQAKLQDGVQPPRYFFVVESNNKAVGVLYCRDEPSRDCLFISYLVVTKPERGYAADKVSALLLSELQQLAKKRKFLVMELAHPDHVVGQEAYNEGISRMRLFAQFAGAFGFEILALDVDYLQPALSPADADTPHLLVIGRRFLTPASSMPRIEASAILDATYSGYAAGADAAFAKRCRQLQDQATQALSDPVGLLRFRDVKERWPAPNKP